MTYHCFSALKQKAQKDHRCVWCAYKILQGSTYVREKSVYDGRHQNHAWHEACRADALAEWRAGADAEFMPGDSEMPFFALYQLEAASP